MSARPVGVYEEATTYARGLPGGAVETLDWWKDERDWWHPTLRQPRYAVCLNSGFNASDPHRSTESALEACRSRLPPEDRPGA